jgi:Flp pilus assembly protein TadD
VYRIRGEKNANKEDMDHAINDYTQAIRQNPNNSMLYNDRGESFNSVYFMWKYDRTTRKEYLMQAWEDYTKALELDPNNATARKNKDEWGN